MLLKKVLRSSKIHDVEPSNDPMISLMCLTHQSCFLILSFTSFRGSKPSQKLALLSFATVVMAFLETSYFNGLTPVRMIPCRILAAPRHVVPPRSSSIAPVLNQVLWVHDHLEDLIMESWWIMAFWCWPSCLTYLDMWIGPGLGCNDL